MFGQLSRLGIDAYVLGIENPGGQHYICKVWPEEKGLGFVNADVFNKIVDEYCEQYLQ